MRSASDPVTEVTPNRTGLTSNLPVHPDSV